jgi:hypothetical protein
MVRSVTNLLKLTAPINTVDGLRNAFKTKVNYLSLIGDLQGKWLYSQFGDD